MVVSATAVTAVAVTFAVVLAGAFAGRGRPGGPRPRCAHHVAARPRASPHGAAGGPAARGGALRHAPDAHGIHPEGAGGAGHRRLPLLPARPRPHRQVGRDGHQRPAGQPRRRAPRDPVPGAGRQGGARPRRWTASRSARAGPVSVAPGWRARAPGSNGAPWLGAWAPGGGERVLAPDLGMPVEAGSRIIMQVHYNLLAGAAPDQSAAKLRVAADDGTRKTLQTVLLPAPVEVPCRPGAPRSALRPRTPRWPTCSSASGRRGAHRRRAAPALPRQQGRPDADLHPTGDPGVDDPRGGRAHAPARHQDLGHGQQGQGRRAHHPRHPDLGLRRPGQPSGEARGQGADRATPSPSRAPTTSGCATCCRRSRGSPERYVVWGEGTTDEMCLGIVMVTRP